MNRYNEDIKWEDLRNKALHIMNEKSRDSGKKQPDETMKLIQDMDVYRVELELEIQRLGLAKELIEQEKNDFQQLFDLAPFAFIELSG